MTSTMTTLESPQSKTSTIIEIERREKLTHEEFVKEYASVHKPVILTDALRHWDAVGKWTPEFFKETFGNTEIDINKVAYTERKGKPREAATTVGKFVDAVLQSSDESPAPYLRNQNLHELFPSLVKDVTPLPMYLSPNWLPEPFALKNVQRVFREHSDLQLYFGGQGGAFPSLHYDILASHAYLMQIYGRKKFVIFSPEQKPYLYLQPNSRNHSQVNVENPDLQKFPLYAKATPTTFVLEAGELLFVPSRWWHATKILTPSISVSLNALNQTNWSLLTDWVCEARNPLLRIPSRLYLNAAGAWRSRRDRRIGFSR